MPFFSIIIPVYNVAPYLRECLDSVLAQTFTDWEAICVDDGSTDGSGAILDEYAAKDTRFRVIHQPNAGTHETRLKALSLIRGEWITFLDADDYIVPERYEKMLDAVKQESADLVWGDIVERRGDAYFYHPFSHAMRRVLPMQAPEILMSMLDSAGYEYEWHVLWSRVYSRSLIDKTMLLLGRRRGEFTMCEDVGWSIAFACMASKMVFVHGAPYVYRRNDLSVTTGTEVSKKRFALVAHDFRESISFAHEMLNVFTNSRFMHDRIDSWFTNYIRGWYRRCPDEFQVEKRTFLDMLGSNIGSPAFGLISLPVQYDDINRIQTLPLEGWWYQSPNVRYFVRFCASLKRRLKRLLVWK